MPPDKAVDLIADRDDQRQHDEQLDRHHQQIVDHAAVLLELCQRRKDRVENIGKDCKEEDGKRHDDEEEGGAAARMHPRHRADVFHGQRQLRLIAANGLVLGPVVGEDALHILHAGDEDHVNQEDDQAEQTLNQVLPYHSAAGQTLEEIPQLHRQQEEEQKGEAHAQDHRDRDQHGHEFLAAQLAFQPAVELGGRFLRLLILRHAGLLGGPHQGLDAVVHTAAEVDDAANHGPGEKAVLGLERLHLFLQALLGIAHHDGLLFRPAHHDALDQRLTADHGFEFFRDRTGFLGHGRWYSLCFDNWHFAGAKCDRYAVIGRLTVTSVPPPSALLSSSVPPCIVTISSQTARPMPEPRALELPL